MCLGIPGKVISIQGNTGLVEFGQVRRNIDLRLLEEVKVGDYVLVHAGFAINKIDEQEARQTLELIRQLSD